MVRILLFVSLSVFLLACGQGRKNANGIVGLAPVDIYLNMEKQGFTTTKNLGTSSGNFWNCKMSLEGIDYQVNIFSSDDSLVENVKGTATASEADAIESDRDHCWPILASGTSLVKCDQIIFPKDNGEPPYIEMFGHLYNLGISLNSLFYPELRNYFDNRFDNESVRLLNIPGHWPI